MARKRERAEPKVPRGPVSPGSPTRPRMVERPVGGAGVFGTEESYAHIKRDLQRIALFGTLIFAGMAVLKLFAGL